MNDNLARCLSGVLKRNRPQFLKYPYNGPKALEELVAFDPGLVVGVLGGGAGTNRDTFELLYQAEKYGARVALFGRKINLAESQLDIVHFMRAVADGADQPVGGRARLPFRTSRTRTSPPCGRWRTTAR